MRRGAAVTYPAFSDLAEVDELIDARYPYSKSGDILSPARLWDDIRQMNEGACSNYATAKLRLMIERGWPIEALRLGCVYVETGEYHAVLTVTHPERGDYMIDSRQPYPLQVADLGLIGYKPDIIQEAGGSSQFVEWKNAELSA